ncbi:MAG: hypothetical protein MUF34_29870 [Polyangiaceae bacterium]|jgi:hypothetical protein|nr:hypothetical protein [Polyangiaceae bacterium]
MRFWPLLPVFVLACGPPPLVEAPVVAERAPLSEAERQHVTECARGLVARADVVRVGWSRYRGRAALAVALSSPNDDLVDAYYELGSGCDLVALVGSGPLDAEVQPGPPFRGLTEARGSALAVRDGFVTNWVLERDDEGDGRWVYRFDVDAGGRMYSVLLDALSSRLLRAEPLSPAPLAPALGPPKPAPPTLHPAEREDDSP